MKPPRAVLSFLWLLFDRGLKMGGGALIGIVLARFLGPEDFGRFAVAMGLAAFGKDVVGLGMDRIIQRDLGAKTEVAGTVVGTYLVMCLTTAIFVGILLTGVAWYTVDDTVTRHMAYLLAWVALPQCLCGTYLWFISQSNTRPLILSLNVSWFAFLALRFYLAFTHAKVSVFAWVALADAAMMYLLAWVLFVKHHPDGSRLHFSKDLLKRYAKEGWPLLVSVFVGVGADRLQLLMVQAVSDNEVAGHFGAGLRITDPWWQITGVAAMAFMPKMIEAQGRGDLRAIYRRYLDASLAMTVVMAVIVTVLAPFVVPLVLGKKYQDSVLPMIILFWSAPGVYVSYSRFQFLAIEKRLVLEIPHCVAMTTLVFGLTWVLVPKFGSAGAALAMFLAGSFTAWVLPWLIPSARDLASDHLHSLSFVLRWRELVATARNMIGARFGKKEAGA